MKRYVFPRKWRIQFGSIGSKKPIEICSRSKYFLNRKIKKLLLKGTLKIKTDEITVGLFDRHNDCVFTHDFVSAVDGRKVLMVKLFDLHNCCCDYGTVKASSKKFVPKIWNRS